MELGHRLFRVRDWSHAQSLKAECFTREALLIDRCFRLPIAETTQMGVFGLEPGHFRAVTFGLTIRIICCSSS
jgi:hypothetical protein